MGPLSRASVVLFLPIIVVLAGLSIGLDLLATTLVRDSRHLVDHTNQTIAIARATLTSMLEAENGYRGFLITGDDADLAPYRAAARDAPVQLGRLAALTADNPEQQRRIGWLQERVANTFRVIEQSIGERREGGLAPTRELMMARKGLGIVDGLRPAVVELIGTEEAQLARQIAAVESRQSLSNLTSVGGAVMALLAGLVAVRLLRRHELRAQIAEATARQAQKMEVVGQLTGGIAHDVNNLLQVILANLDLAVRNLASHEVAAGFIQNAVLGAEKGAKLTSQLLAFARRQPLRPQVLDIARQVPEIVSLLRRALGERIEVEVVGAAGLWRTKADPALLQNALLNLAINARDAMPEGGKLTIEFGNMMLDAAYAARHQEVSPGQYVMLAVSDTGAGMTGEVAASAFEPFYTTKADGTGLGLSMVYGFVKQSGGHVKIYSEPGQGTTVRLYLPRTQEEAPCAAVDPARPMRGAGQAILVVEDDDGVRAGVSAQLADLGYRVVAAPDGETALKLLLDGTAVDLLFTDVILPGPINGRRLVREVARLRPGLPVVYTSGYTENAIIHHGRLDEGVVLLSKPYRTVDLAAAIGSVLASRPAAAAAPPVAPAGGAAPAVLVVEDDRLLRTAFAALLSGWGYRVQEADSADEAVRWVRNGVPFSLMITDLGLPDRNGIVLAAEVRAVAPAIDIIVVTGRDSVPHAADLAGPPVRVLLKPFAAGELAHLVRELLGDGEPVPATAGSS